MMLLPEDALVPDGGRYPGSQQGARTFGDFWRDARAHIEALASSGPGGPDGRPEGELVPSVACGTGALLEVSADVCPAGEMRCWMRCQTIDFDQKQCESMWRQNPGSDRYGQFRPQCVSKGTGLLKDPEEMCDDCIPVCGLDADSTGPIPSPGKQEGEQAFCLSNGGGTTMYMSGFKWTSSATEETCVAFLFPSLVINQRWKLAAACVGAIAIAASLELANAAKRAVTKPARSKRFPLAARGMGLALQALMLTLAYVAMLFVMTYSLELFFSVIIGLVLGPMLFGSLSTGPKGAGGANGVAGGEAHAGAGAPCCRMAAGQSPGDGANEYEIGVSRPQEVALQVRGMTCESCETTVRSALETVRGVVSAKVSCRDGSATVLYLSPATPEELVEAISEVGFTAACEGSAQTSSGNLNRSIV
uniref:Copper transport protein n=1 Tax=Zooxanthella nutricula TaxID=1333877 RepID=A0A7S2KLP6_9DINO|mmetsp:Transcript_49415/g.150363  ORF Transcript_49415/g.150363 Transcript_49415/m.150363 type:complete len:419 (+) Transcript_49415:3-1259(+)